MTQTAISPALRIDQTEGVIRCYSPATRQELGEVKVDSPADVRRKVVASRRAQAQWGQTSFKERRAVLRDLLAVILDRADSLCDQICADSGKTRENAMMGEVWPVAAKLQWTIKNGEKHLRPEPVSSGMLMHKKARLEFHPLGVVGAILPWNYPMQNVLNPIITALMAGNGIIVKPSEWTAYSSVGFIDMVRDVLSARGHDPDLVGLVQGFATTGRALIEGVEEDGKVEGADVIVFIGSVPNGRRILESAAKRLIPVVLELGGKDPFIVCDDADVEQAVHAALGGTFINCGQNCVASERILLDERIAPAFERRVQELVSAFRQGPPGLGEVNDVGAMITPIQLDLVEGLVNDAIESGARVVTGGRRVQSERGEFFAPTVLADVTPDMRIMNEEVFGPVMLLCKVSSDDEAIRVANGTDFGLSCSVFSKDNARANRIAKQVQSGMVSINEFGGMTYMAQDLTFGGVKDSGYGRMNGREGLRSLCNTKAVLDDRVPLHMANKLFPVGPTHYAMARAAIRTLYGPSLSAKLAGVRDMLGGLKGGE